MCRLSWNLVASTSWNPEGLFRCYKHEVNKAVLIWLLKYVLWVTFPMYSDTPATQLVCQLVVSRWKGPRNDWISIIKRLMMRPREEQGREEGWCAAIPAYNELNFQPICSFCWNKNATSSWACIYWNVTAPGPSATSPVPIEAG